jgi:hypothetical protein
MWARGPARCSVPSFGRRGFGLQDPMRSFRLARHHEGGNDLDARSWAFLRVAIFPILGAGRGGAGLAAPELVDFNHPLFDVDQP